MYIIFIRLKKYSSHICHLIATNWAGWTVPIDLLAIADNIALHPTVQIWSFLSEKKKHNNNRAAETMLRVLNAVQNQWAMSQLLHHLYKV